MSLSRTIARATWRALSRLSTGCGKLPLVAAIALLAVARVMPILTPQAPAPMGLASPALTGDLATIDGVLAERAPDLGLVLRRQLCAAIAEESARAKYDPMLVLAIIAVESEFDEEALSNRGARGLMQIRPSTLQFLATREGLRLSRQEVENDPALQVRLGIRYLRQLQDKLGNLDLALMAYNAGPAKVRRARKDGELDGFRRYAAQVRRKFRAFRRGEGLDADWALAEREPVAPASRE